MKLNVLGKSAGEQSEPVGETVQQIKSSFRLDVVGLRALAVLFVMLHHFNIPGFGGAFYGPDIFF